MDQPVSTRALQPAQLAICGGTPIRSAALPPRVHVTEPIRDDMMRLIDSGSFSDWRGGQYVAQFEEAFARWHGPDYHCIAVNSGTSALHLACSALGIGPGDEVIIPCAAYVSAASAVVQMGG